MVISSLGSWAPSLSSPYSLPEPGCCDHGESQPCPWGTGDWLSKGSGPPAVWNPTPTLLFSELYIVLGQFEGDQENHLPTVNQSQPQRDDLYSTLCCPPWKGPGLKNEMPGLLSREPISSREAPDANQNFFLLPVTCFRTSERRL